MRNILHIILIFFFAFTFSSCGSDSASKSLAANSSGSDGTNGKNSLISTTDESAGANCSTGGLKIQSGIDNDGDNVLDSNEVTATKYVCNGTGGVKPSSSLYCGASLQNTSLYFTYKAMVFSDSSVFVYGGIYGAAYQIGASSYYDSSQNGASTASVLFAYDVSGSANGGYWKIEVNRSTRAATIVYTDSDVSGGSDTWTLPSSSSNCVLNSY